MNSAQKRIFLRVLSLIIIQATMIALGAVIYINTIVKNDTINLRYAYAKSLSDNISKSIDLISTNIQAIVTEDENEDLLKLRINTLLRITPILDEFHFFKKGSTTIEEIKHLNEFQELISKANNSNNVQFITLSNKEQGLLIFAIRIKKDILLFTHKYKTGSNFFIEGLITNPLDGILILDKRAQIISQIGKKPLSKKVVSRFIKDRGYNSKNPLKYKAKESIDELRYKNGDDSFYLLSRRITGTPLILVYAFNNKVLVEKRDHMFMIILLILLISIFIALLLSLKTSSSFTQIIKNISYKADKIKKGDFSEDNLTHENVDIQRIYDDLDRINHKIKNQKTLGLLWPESENTDV